MTVFPINSRISGPTISTASYISCSVPPYFNILPTNMSSSASFPTANLALFYPFYLNQTIVVTKLFAINGSSASNNIDIGIYNDDGVRIVSTGSTARSGTTAIQSFDITDTTIGPGRFFFAIAQNGGVGSYFAANSSATVAQAWAKMAGIYQQTSAFPLPANATFATYAQTNFYVPFIGLVIAPTTII